MAMQAQRGSGVCCLLSLTSALEGSVWLTPPFGRFISGYDLVHLV